LESELDTGGSRRSALTLSAFALLANIQPRPYTYRMCLSLREIEALVDALPQSDRARLLEYLRPRVEQAPKQPSPEACAEAWKKFREVGERLAATDTPGSASIVKAITEERR
jgi:hypothetical protein